MNMTHLRLYQVHQAVRALIIYQLLYHYQISENYRQLQAFFYLAALENSGKIPVNQKTASRANSKKTGKTPSIKDLETNNSIRFSRFSIEKLRKARYFNHRSYRFNSVDPVINRVAALSNPQLWNLYAYCRNNPITYFDPYGRDILEDLKRKATQGLNHIVPNVIWMDSSNAEKMKRDKATLEKALALTAGVALAFALMEEVYSDDDINRMKDGKAPKDDQGKPIELHHEDQDP